MSGLFPELEVELSLHPFDQKEVALPSCASAGPRKIHLCFQYFKYEGGGHNTSLSVLSVCSRCVSMGVGIRHRLELSTLSVLL